MPALATPDTIAGPLTAADLDAARQHSTGRVLPLHRATFVDTVPVQAAEACTEVGADAVESMWRYRRTRSTVVLAAVLAVIGYAAHLIWPLA